MSLTNLFTKIESFDNNTLKALLLELREGDKNMQPINPELNSLFDECKKQGDDWLDSYYAIKGKIESEIVDRAVDIGFIETTKLIWDTDDADNFMPTPMWITECCKRGPITDENYCSRCGKKIERTNESQMLL